MKILGEGEYKQSWTLIPIGAMMLALGGVAQGLNWLGVPFLRGGKWRKPGSPCPLPVPADGGSHG